MTIEKGFYKHYKGGLYVVIGTAKHSETLEDLVVYQNHKGDLWVRPAEMFLEVVEVGGKRVSRFAPLDLSKGSTG
jgi:hypothetical protein